MSETIPEGTMIHLRITRRFAGYNIGDVIAEPVGSARELVAKRLAVTVGTMAVPIRPGSAAENPPSPQRAPGTLVRK